MKCHSKRNKEFLQEGNSVSLIGRKSPFFGIYFLQLNLSSSNVKKKNICYIFTDNQTLQPWMYLGIWIVHHSLYSQNISFAYSVKQNLKMGIFLNLSWLDQCLAICDDMLHNDWHLRSSESKTAPLGALVLRDVVWRFPVLLAGFYYIEKDTDRLDSSKVGSRDRSILLDRPPRQQEP